MRQMCSPLLLLLLQTTSLIGQQLIQLIQLVLQQLLVRRWATQKKEESGKEEAVEETQRSKTKKSEENKETQEEAWDVSHYPNIQAPNLRSCQQNSSPFS